MKVLVVKRDKIGDLLLTTPMLAHLKRSRPGVEVHLLANDYNAWVVEGNAHVDRVWVYRRVRAGRRVSLAAAWQTLRLEAALRAERYDWVIVANGDESPRAIGRALRARGARTVAVCADPARYRRLSDPLAPEPGRHEIERLLSLLVPLGIAPPERADDPRYVLPERSAAFARAWLAERRLAPGGYIVLGLGARRAKKQPSTAQVLAWSAHFKRAWGLETVFMWTPGRADDPLYPGDDEVAQPVLAARAPHIHPHRGPIWEALGLVWSARTSLFPDSGLMHFAAASPGGVLGFFAETDVSPPPSQWAPRGPRADWLEARRSVAELADALVLERVARLVHTDHR
ncbi:MAG: glycosyltransferase family 9 protein [Burkholderiales bacterium]|nr:glycosyltransferase family 9 protein [Burkholderiales bacterium]